MLITETFCNMNAEEIVKRIWQQVCGDDQQPPFPFPVVEGSITPIIDDPARLLPEGECEECGGPCRWEYANRFGDF